jgi:hypothetical protein
VKPKRFLTELKRRNVYKVAADDAIVNTVKGLFTVVLLSRRYHANAGGLLVELLDYRLE